MKKIIAGMILLGTFTAGANIENNNRVSHQRAAKKPPCGLEGTIEERIERCSSQAGSTIKGFVLVSRLPDSREFYKELSSNLIWSNRLPKEMNQYDAILHCNAFKNPAGTTTKWRLPTLQEYKEAEQSGIRDLSEDMAASYYWSSDATCGAIPTAHVFNAYDGTTKRIKSDFDIDTYTRCVTKIEE